MATIMALVAGSMLVVSGHATAKQDGEKHSGGAAPKGGAAGANHGTSSSTEPANQAAAPQNSPQSTENGDPAGNNGTIKIDGLPFDDAPDNEPHPGCIFQLDFYGFDAGPLDADVSFEAIAPTSGGVVRTDVVPIGEDSHAGGGSEAGLDASRTYDLSTDLAGITPHPKQGWHVKVTIHADGSQGADVKHKVFWVEECAASRVAAATAGSATGQQAKPAAGSSVLGTIVEAGHSDSAVLAAEVSRTTGEAPTAEVLGVSIERGSSSAASPLATVLARTGMGLGLVSLALALIVGGAALLRLRSRDRLEIP
jgi:hypothetical protein